MKRFATMAAACALIIAQFACTAKNGPGGPVSLKTENDRYSYMIGQDIGKSLKDLDSIVQIPVLMRGIEDALKNRSSMLTEEEMMKLKQNLSMKMQSAMMAKQQVSGDKNKTEGEKFLAENKSKPGVVTTASGLQYMILKAGSGPRPLATDKVSVHYKGTLLDGTKFDSSYDRNQPVTFPVNGVIPGWTEALQLMKVGGKYKLFIPANLGYGERGAGDKIGPNAVLIFEVELLKIEKSS
jgi:FKBP-type peptidyl-prolyl cis-trans isomerase FkpA/FKBP-type peptidyl-prolyl cis-trans isomerase FklB